jgi:drug/metabolite transporter (DMT)-like permease
MPALPPAERPRQNRLAGIGFRVGGATCFAFMAVMIKLAYAHGVSTPELLFYRVAFGMPPLLVWMAMSGTLGAWRTQRPLAHFWRTFVGLASMALAFSGLFYLPLAESTTIGFAAPLFAVMLSALVLGEKVGIHRWSAVAVGFAGVLVVMQPETNHLPLIGLALALGSAFGVAIVTITIRQISRTEPTQTIVFWFTFLSMLVTGSLMPFYAQVHDGWTWAILLTLGLFGGLGQILMTGSLGFAPVSTVVPFDYSQLLWAVLLGWLVFASPVLPTTWIGAAAIVGSGLYTLYREHRLGREKARITPPL